MLFRSRQELQETVDRSLDNAARRLDGLFTPTVPGRPNRPGAFEQILVQRVAGDGTIIEGEFERLDERTADPGGPGGRTVSR